MEGDRTVYLIPTFDTDAEASEAIEQIYPVIFENEL